MDPLPIIYTSPKERSAHAFGDIVHFYLVGEETGGQFVQGKITVAPGGGPPLHYHENEDEWFFVLAGEASFYADGQWHPAAVGDRISCPRHSVHAYKNTGNQPLELLLIASPAGFETFFSRCAAEFASPGGPSEQRLFEIAAEHGIGFVPAEPGSAPGR